MPFLLRCWTVALLLLASRSASAQTLRDVLREFDLPLRSGGPSDLDVAISSYSAENWTDLFVIVYYPRGSDRSIMPDTLRLSAFDRQSRRWTHAALERRREAAPAWEVGPVLGIQHSDGLVLLGTHRDPASGTVIVLSRALRPLAALDGSLLKLLPGGRVFYQRSAPHAAEQQVADLWTWDPESALDTRVYTAPSDSSHGSASSIRSRIRTDDTGTAVVFLVQMGVEGDSPARSPVLDVVVTCRGAGSARVSCMEVELKALQSRHPGWSTTRILDDLIETLPPSPVFLR